MVAKDIKQKREREAWVEPALKMILHSAINPTKPESTFYPSHAYLSN
jgi:hypothetical protein